jgi:4-hydroxythreonine-4-phosphate dehydrogenase
MARTPPIVALTPGEPAGIGPELALAIADQPLDARLIAITDAAMLRERARQMGLDVEVVVDDVPDAAPGDGRIVVHNVPFPGRVACGRPDPANAAALVECMNVAARGCMDGRWQAMVTGPVNKAVINDGGIAFSGHTEHLARIAGADLPVMMLTSETMRVALVTTHLPLADVPDAITRPRLLRTLEILDNELKMRFGIAGPRILVCGLNPHAGEGGHLGSEEIEVIEPALAEARRLGIDAVGPLPADTLFTADRLAGAAAVLAMYHDQGLPVLKYAGFGKAVNVTLGLPFVRTSVDHGTALDIAGSGRADPGSLLTAIRLAAQLARGRDH